MEHLKKFYANKRVLVTGGAGFIGSHLVEKLVEYGARVTVFDNFSAGCMNNVRSVIHAVSFFYADVRSVYSCLKATAGHDIVFHLASFVSVPESVLHPDVCNNINVDGTHNMLEACKKNKISSFVFSSSSAVYGTKNGVCREDDQLHPESPYAHSKLQAENLCKQYADICDMNVAIMRYFNVYGDRQNPNGPYAAVVARFTQQLLAGRPLVIFGDGQQTRDFVHVSHVVEANMVLGAQSELRGAVFNVGSGNSITVLDLVKKLEQELKVSRAALTFLPARQGDIQFSQADCNKYKKVLTEVFDSN